MPAPRISILSHLRRTAFPSFTSTTKPLCASTPLASHTRPAQQSRTFTSTRQSPSWLLPKRKLEFKDPKGRPRMAVGGSVRGTTVVWGDYGLRLRDHDRRISAKQLRVGEEAIRKRLRGTNFRLFSRWTASTAVYTKGNESRMGTGKGNFDYWAVRMPVSRVLFEVKSDAHEQVIKDAMRLAGNKLPGNWEFVRKGDAPVMGITKLGNGVTEQDLRKPRKKLPAEETASRIPSAAGN